MIIIIWYIDHIFDRKTIIYVKILCHLVYDTLDPIFMIVFICRHHAIEDQIEILKQGANNSSSGCLFLIQNLPTEPRQRHHRRTAQNARNTSTIFLCSWLSWLYVPVQVVLHVVVHIPMESWLCHFKVIYIYWFIHLDMEQYAACSWGD